MRRAVLVNRLFNVPQFSFVIWKKNIFKNVFLLNVPKGSEFQFPALMLKEAETQTATLVLL